MSKQSLCNSFLNDVDSALNAWINRRVIPLSDLYSNALTTYNAVLKEREAELQRKREYFMIALTVVGTAALAWGPAAAAIAAGSRAFRGGVLLRASNIVSQLGKIDRIKAYKVMKSFTYGPAKEVVAGLASGPGKAALTAHLDQQFTATYGGGGGAQTELRYRNMLESVVRSAAQDLHKTGQFLRDSAIIDEKVAAIAIDALFSKAEFFQNAPITFSGRHALASRTSVNESIPQQTVASLGTDMQKSLWSSWCLSLKSSRHRCTYRRFGRDFVRVGCRNENVYADVSWAVQRHMQKLGIKLKGGKGVSDHFGMYQSDGDSEDLIAWAEKFLRNQASKNSKVLGRYT